MVFLDPRPCLLAFTWSIHLPICHLTHKPTLTPILTHSYLLPLTSTNTHPPALTPMIYTHIHLHSQTHTHTHMAPCSLKGAGGSRHSQAPSQSGAADLSALKAQGRCAWLTRWSRQHELTNKSRRPCCPDNRAFLPWGMWLQGNTGIHFPCHCVTPYVMAAISPDKLLKWSLQMS